MNSTPDDKKKDFEDKFSTLVNDHVENYNGEQPILSWKDDKPHPEIAPGFFSTLPLKLQEDIELLLSQIAG